MWPPASGVQGNTRTGGAGAFACESGVRRAGAGLPHTRQISSARPCRPSIIFQTANENRPRGGGSTICMGAGGQAEAAEGPWSVLPLPFALRSFFSNG